MRKNPLFINGEWIETTEISVRHDPFRGTPYSATCLANSGHVSAAIDAATKASDLLATVPAYQRSKWLRQIASKLRENEQEIAESIISENGKVFSFSKREVGRSAETLEFSANEALRLGGEVIPLDASARGEKRLGFYIRVPVGVVGMITPFNSPLNLLCHKVGPALAAGNAIVAKVDPRTASCAVHLCKIMEAFGLPAGAMNLVHGGADIGTEIVKHPNVRLVSFTGGGAAAEKIVAQAGVKPVLLELGGNAGNIVCADANLALAAKDLSTNAYNYSGQSCVGVQRIYVEDAIYEDFLTRFVEATKAQRVGDPWDSKTDIGPMISEEAARRIMQWIDEARSAGAKVVAGGNRNGLLVEPTILTEVKPDMKVVCEEVFGPVATVQRVANLDEAISAVNDSRYGLQAGLFTASLANSLSAIRKLKVGGVVVNGTSNYRLEHQPYGGVKRSGIGREGPAYAIEHMTDIRMVVLQ